MNSLIDSCLLMTLFTKSFGNCSKSAIDVGLLTLITDDDVTGRKISSRMLQDYVSQKPLGSVGNCVMRVPCNDLEEEKEADGRKKDHLLVL